MNRTSSEVVGATEAPEGGPAEHPVVGDASGSSGGDVRLDLQSPFRMARRRLLRAATETGAWRAACDAGPATTALVVVGLSFIGELDPATRGATGRYLAGARLRGGLFAARPGGTQVDLCATAACIAGLIATEQALTRAEEQFLASADRRAKLLELAKEGDLSALALAMVGALSPDHLPRAPLLFQLAPGVSEWFLEQRFAFVVPFRALLTDVLVHHLRRGKEPGDGFLGVPRFGALAATLQDQGDRWSRSVQRLPEQSRAFREGLIRETSALLGDVGKETSRAFAAVARGGLMAASGVVDGARRGPMGVLEGLASGARQGLAAAGAAAQAALGISGRTAPAMVDKGVSLARSTEGVRCELYLRRFRNADGSFLYGDAVHTILALAALHALGVPHRDRRIAEGLRWIEGQKHALPGEQARYAVFTTDVWPTAFGLRALLLANVSPTNAVVTRAANWLIDCQRHGSWAFQGTNTTTPDIDDTAVALAALAIFQDRLLAVQHQGEAVSDWLLQRCRRAIESAQQYLLARQNPDGGWASYQVGLPSKRPGAIMTERPRPPGESTAAQIQFALDPPADVGDPATEDVTGRTLYALGKAGFTMEHPAVQRAVRFLREQQAGNGGWWGRWVVNFVAATAWVVRGLVAVRADLDQPWITRAVDFLIARQHRADGGWGDPPESYQDPEVAGNTSNPMTTALVISALIEYGWPRESKPVRLGIAHLNATVGDPQWKPSDTDLLHTLFPPDLFYTLPLTELQLPLEALGLYHYRMPPRAPVEIYPGAAPPAPPLTRGHLDELRRQGDDDADQIFAKVSIADVNRVLHRIFTNAEDPPLGDLPEHVRQPLEEFFAKTQELPGKPDMAAIRRGQALFERQGWGVATALFCSSLPQCYAFPEGAEVLLATGAFTSDPRRRVIETAQLIFDVAEPGGLDATGKGIRTCQKVRLIHAGIRKLMADAGQWPHQHSVPLSQQQLLGTLMAFSTVVTDGLRALGFPLEARDVEDWYHLWRSVGPILGIRPDIVPATAAEGAELFDELRRGFWGPSRQGVALADSTLGLARDLIPGDEFDGVVDVLVRHLAGDHCADLLQVPVSGWTRLFEQRPRVFDRLWELFFEATLFQSPLAPLLQKAAFVFMETLAEEERDGKNVKFRIPPSLRARWRNEFRLRHRQLEIS